MRHELECSSCNSIYPPGGYPHGCPACFESGNHGLLQVIFDYDELNFDSLPFENRTTLTSMWKYQELLPLVPKNPITLGEGGTPLLRANSLSSNLDLNVFYKNETVNPTWSFKDRLYSLMISNIAEFGYNKVVNSSTGNAGASAAAYASRANIPDILILSPHECELPLRNQILSYGAELAILDFESRSSLLNLLVNKGWYPVTNGLHYSSEGYKTIAFELIEQLEEVPEAIVFPTGIGDGLFGIWNGFKVLHRIGIISELPRMIGVQSEERQPLVRAISSNLKEAAPDVGPMPITISTSGTMTGTYALNSVKESKGCAYAISFDEIKMALKEMGKDGLFVEPATALTAAGVKKAHKEGEFDKGDTVICIATGTGIKWPRGISPLFDPVPTISPTLESLEDATSFIFKGQE